MNQVKFVEDSFQKIWREFFKGCLPQILLDPFLNTLSYLTLSINPFSRGIELEQWAKMG